MPKNTNKQEEERRSGSERRVQAIELGFPFVDSHGHLVTYERRKHDRRRLAPAVNHQKNYA